MKCLWKLFAIIIYERNLGNRKKKLKLKCDKLIIKKKNKNKEITITVNLIKKILMNNDDIQNFFIKIEI